MEKREYGIEIFFLVYSDVRSSQIIFEELMKNVGDRFFMLYQKRV